MTGLFVTSVNFRCLLITTANSLDPDQVLKIIGPNLDLNFLTLMVLVKAFLKEISEKRKSAGDILGCKITKNI